LGINSILVLFILLLSNGCVSVIVGTELTAIMYKNTPTLQQAAIKEKQKAIATAVKDTMCKAFPGEIKDWILIPRNNCSFDKYYTPIGIIEQEYYYRKSDGSDNIIIKSFINPSKKGIDWYEGMIFIPDTAQKIELGDEIQAWIHEEYQWDWFLASYDKDRNRGKCSVASLYIGNWHIESEIQNEVNDLRTEDRKDMLRRIMYGKEYPELKPATGPLDPEQLPQSILNPILYVNSSRAIKPSSMPNSSSSAIYPHCVAIRVIASNRDMVMQAISLIKLKDIQHLTKLK
jgi:hypothetical protein